MCEAHVEEVSVTTAHDARITIYYTLYPFSPDGETKQRTVPSPHVPRVGELVAADFSSSYEVVDVLWHLDNDEPTVSITAVEKDWHTHIDEVKQERTGAGLNPSQLRHLELLMSQIDWPRGERGQSTLPKPLNDELDQYRWSMLLNALLDWDRVQEEGVRSAPDAAHRLATVYLLPIFDGAGPEVDRTLGNLLVDPMSPPTEDDSPAVAEAFGRRWREDVCATAWKLILADRQRHN